MGLRRGAQNLLRLPANAWPYIVPFDSIEVYSTSLQPSPANSWKIVRRLSVKVEKLLRLSVVTSSPNRYLGSRV